VFEGVNPMIINYIYLWHIFGKDEPIGIKFVLFTLNKLCVFKAPWIIADFWPFLAYSNITFWF
jgi:hypothetical protein